MDENYVLNDVFGEAPFLFKNIIKDCISELNEEAEGLDLMLNHLTLSDFIG